MPRPKKQPQPKPARGRGRGAAKTPKNRASNDASGILGDGDTVREDDVEQSSRHSEFDIDSITSSFGMIERYAAHQPQQQQQQKGTQQQFQPGCSQAQPVVVDDDDDDDEPVKQAAAAAAPPQSPSSLTSTKALPVVDVPTKSAFQQQQQQQRQRISADHPVAAWLQSLGLIGYIGAFFHCGFDVLPACALLCEDDFDKLGVTPIGHRRVLLDAAQKLQRAAEYAREEKEREQRQAAGVVNPMLALLSTANNNNAPAPKGKGGKGNKTKKSAQLQQKQQQAAAAAAAAHLPAAVTKSTAESAALSATVVNAAVGNAVADGQWFVETRQRQAHQHHHFPGGDRVAAVGNNTSTVVVQPANPLALRQQAAQNPFATQESRQGSSSSVASAQLSLQHHAVHRSGDVFDSNSSSAERQQRRSSGDSGGGARGYCLAEDLSKGKGGAPFMTLNLSPPQVVSLVLHGGVGGGGGGGAGGSSSGYPQHHLVFPELAVASSQAFLPISTSQALIDEQRKMQEKLTAELQTSLKSIADGAENDVEEALQQLQVQCDAAAHDLSAWVRARRRQAVEAAREVVSSFRGKLHVLDYEQQQQQQQQQGRISSSAAEKKSASDGVAPVLRQQQQQQRTQRPSDCDDAEAVVTNNNNDSQQQQQPPTDCTPRDQVVVMNNGNSNGRSSSSDIMKQQQQQQQQLLQRSSGGGSKSRRMTTHSQNNNSVPPDAAASSSSSSSSSSQLEYHNLVTILRSVGDERWANFFAEESLGSQRLTEASARSTPQAGAMTMTMRGGGGYHPTSSSTSLPPSQQLLPTKDLVRVNVVLAWGLQPKPQQQQQKQVSLSPSSVSPSSAMQTTTQRPQPRPEEAHQEQQPTPNKSVGEDSAANADITLSSISGYGGAEQQKEREHGSVGDQQQQVIIFAEESHPPLSLVVAAQPFSVADPSSSLSSSQQEVQQQQRLSTCGDAAPSVYGCRPNESGVIGADDDNFEDGTDEFRSPVELQGDASATAMTGHEMTNEEEADDSSALHQDVAPLRRSHQHTPLFSSSDDDEEEGGGGSGDDAVEQQQGDTTSSAAASSSSSASSSSCSSISDFDLDDDYDEANGYDGDSALLLQCQEQQQRHDANAVGGDGASPTGRHRPAVDDYDGPHQFQQCGAAADGFQYGHAFSPHNQPKRSRASCFLLSSSSECPSSASRRRQQQQQRLSGVNLRNGDDDNDDDNGMNNHAGGDDEPGVVATDHDATQELSQQQDSIEEEGGGSTQRLQQECSSSSHQFMLSQHLLFIDVDEEDEEEDEEEDAPGGRNHDGDVTLDEEKTALAASQRSQQQQQQASASSQNNNDASSPSISSSARKSNNNNNNATGSSNKTTQKSGTRSSRGGGGGDFFDVSGFEDYAGFCEQLLGSVRASVARSAGSDSVARSSVAGMEAMMRSGGGSGAKCPSSAATSRRGTTTLQGEFLETETPVSAPFLQQQQHQQPRGDDDDGSGGRTHGDVINDDDAMMAMHDFSSFYDDEHQQQEDIQDVSAVLGARSGTAASAGKNNDNDNDVSSWLEDDQAFLDLMAENQLQQYKPQQQQQQEQALGDDDDDIGDAAAPPPQQQHNTSSAAALAALSAFQRQKHRLPARRRREGADHQVHNGGLSDEASVTDGHQYQQQVHVPPPPPPSPPRRSQLERMSLGQLISIARSIGVSNPLSVPPHLRRFRNIDGLAVALDAAQRSFLRMTTAQQQQQQQQNTGRAAAAAAAPSSSSSPSDTIATAAAIGPAHRALLCDIVRAKISTVVARHKFNHACRKLTVSVKDYANELSDARLMFKMMCEMQRRRQREFAKRQQEREEERRRLCQVSSTGDDDDGSSGGGAGAGGGPSSSSAMLEEAMMTFTKTPPHDLVPQEVMARYGASSRCQADYDDDDNNDGADFPPAKTIKKLYKALSAEDKLELRKQMKPHQLVQREHFVANSGAQSSFIHYSSESSRFLFAVGPDAAVSHQHHQTQMMTRGTSNWTPFERWLIRDEPDIDHLQRVVTDLYRTGGAGTSSSSSVSQRRQQQQQQQHLGHHHQTKVVVTRSLLKGMFDASGVHYVGGHAMVKMRNNNNRNNNPGDAQSQQLTQPLQQPARSRFDFSLDEEHQRQNDGGGGGPSCPADDDGIENAGGGMMMMMASQNAIASPLSPHTSQQPACSQKASQDELQKRAANFARRNRF